MRGAAPRVAAAAIASLLAIITAEPASAGRVSLSPDPVRQNDKLTVKWRKCRSGDGYDAYGWIALISPAGENLYERAVPTNGKGKARKKILIKKKRFPVGEYRALLGCLHETDGHYIPEWRVERSVTVTQGPSVGKGRVSLNPNPVRQNDRLTVKWRKCPSGEGYEAYGWILILTEEAESLYESVAPTNSKGRARKKILIKKKRFPAGEYQTLLGCLHESGGNYTTHWRRDRVLKVNKK